MTKRSRILAAEDSPTQAVVLEALLTDAGFDVVVASDGESALDVLADEPVDLLISDVVMPGIDGYELCRRAKEGDEHLPVMLLTSLSDPLDVINALSAGADNFLRKPYQPDELIHRARSMLFNRELREHGRTQMGLEVFFLGRKFMINADREQILDLLMSTFEDLVATNKELRVRDVELMRAHEETTAQLAATELERDRLQAVLAALPDAVVVVDEAGVIVEANAALARALRVAPDALPGCRASEVARFVDHRGHVLEGSERPVRRSLETGETTVVGNAFDLHVERADGSVFPAIASAAPITAAGGAIVGAVGVLQDIGALADFDAVTGLPGHGTLMERMRSAFGSGRPCALLVVVVDRYERIRALTSAAGHDRVISTVVRRLERTLESSRVRQMTAGASAAYLGAGEIAVVLPDLAGQADAIVIGELVVEQVAGDLTVEGVAVPLSVSVGVGMLGDGPDPWRFAATVAAAAREGGRGDSGRVVTPDPSLHAAVLDGLRREQELRTAIATDQLVVHYQPQLQLRGGAPVAAEALVRWQHPERGLLGAADVVPLAVQANLISAVSWWVLRDACRQAAVWQRELPHGERFALSVNLAPEQLCEPDVVGEITRIVADTGIDPTHLVLEITEGSVTNNPQEAGERLAALKALGIQIAVDDFGTGYSSLLQLRQLPIDILKIDRSFVANMTDQPADAAIVAGTVRLARALGLEVVAEGVETVDQLVQLRVLGCDLGQGYHWSKPVPAEDFARWWTEHDLTAPAAELVPMLDESESSEVEDTIAYLIHELRSPLAAVTGFAELLAEGPEGATDTRFVEAIIRNARALEARLAEVDQTRSAMQGEIALALEELDASAFVSTLLHDLSDQLHPHPVRLEADGRAVITADPARLGQAVTNLLSNAAKFSPAASAIGVRVGVDDGRAVIAVRDGGPGVPAHRRNELFRRFSRLGSRHKGMGVGLYLSRLIIDAHGGQLAYAPADGGGSVFTVTLPLADS